MRNLLDKLDSIIYAFQRWGKGELPDWANPKWNRRCHEWMKSKGPTVQYLIMGAVAGSIYVIGYTLIHLFSD